MDRLRKRASETAERAAAGSAVPAGTEPGAQGHKPRVRERGSMRRRLRELRQRREALLAELGAVVLEMNRQDRHDTGLVERKVAELRSVDDEARALDTALGDGADLDGVLREGISGACSGCGALMGTDDNFCARCGTAAAAAEPDTILPPAPPAPVAETAEPNEPEPGGNDKTPADSSPVEQETDPGQAVVPEGGEPAA